MSSFHQEFTATGPELTVGDLRALADWAALHDVPDTSVVEVHVQQDGPPLYGTQTTITVSTGR